MFKQIFSFFVLTLIFSGLYAQQGKHGAKTIAAANVIVNEYTSLTADVASGANSLNVSLSTLNANSRFPGSLQSGDLIMVIQVQGASIESSVNSSAWGTIQNLNNCGNYEFAEVLSVPNATSITISCPLTNSYSASGKTQVIRVPRYTTLLINNGGELTSAIWNGTIGGIVAVEVLGDITISSGGKIELSGKGFRGGILAEDLADWGIGDWVWPTGNYGAEKGEGIAGFQIEYDAFGGRYCKAAPANGGGGANAHNAGGGGGANAGDVNLWTGKGNPDISNANWITAWNLEGTNFANSTSTGGGRGGYTFSTSNQNALVIGPHEVSGVSVWGGDLRSNNGGWGGRPLDYSSGKIFMGGGGGSGDQNDLKGGSGGNGGGIAYILGYGNLNGAGQVIANGANGVNSTSGNGISSSGADGAGGGGGGGAIILNVSGIVSGISTSANGGNGGNQIINTYYNSTQSQAEGPGGGGGGGFIALSNGSITKTVNGGSNGTTNSTALNEFPPNGATRGGSGINNATITNFSILALSDTICAGQSVVLSASFVGNPPVGSVISWYNAAVGGTILGTGTTFTTPVLNSNTTYYVGTCPGTFQTPVNVIVSVPLAEAGNNLTVCSGGNVNLNGSGGVTYQWSPSTSLNNSNIQNPVASPTTTTTYYLTVTNAYGCQAIDSVKVSVGALIANAGNDISVCPGSSTQLDASGGTNYSWSPSVGLNSSNIYNPIASPTSTTLYTVTVSDGSNCSATDQVVVTVNPAVMANAGTDVTICPGNSVQISASGGTAYQWSPVTDLTNPSIGNPVASPAQTTIYTVTVTDGNGCSATDNVSINIVQLAEASFVANSVCANDSAYFVNNSTCNGCTITSWDWNFGDLNGSISQQPSHLYNAPGYYDVTLTIESSNGCVDSVTQNISVNAVPDASFNMVGLPDCTPVLAYFSDNSSGTVNWQWSFGDGASSSLQSPSHNYIAGGSYSVNHIVITANGCSDTASMQVQVFNSPDAQYTVASNTVVAGTLVNFTNLSTGASIWQWNFGDGNTSASQNPVNTFNTEGTYTVLLTVSDANACTDTISMEIIVILDVVLEVPNVFTPNHDGFNDLLVIKDLEKVSVNKLTVFNRWGKVVFEASNYANNWNGADVDDGVYYFILTYLEKEIHGTISVER